MVANNDPRVARLKQHRRKEDIALEHKGKYHSYMVMKRIFVCGGDFTDATGAELGV